MIEVEVTTGRIENVMITKRNICLVLILATLAFFQAVSDANAAMVSLAWNRNPESDIAGYRIHYGTRSQRYTLVADVGNFTTCTIAGLSNYRTYYIVCTAYNTAGLESDYSAQVVYTPRIRRR